MDDEALAAPLHDDALRGLRRINALSFTARAFWIPILDFARDAGRPIRVLDIATGGGDAPIAMSRFARKAGVAVSISGCDKSPTALEFAARRAKELGADVSFFRLDILAESIPDPYDVIVNSLFLHHLDPDDVVRVLIKMQTARMALVSDLRRSGGGLILAYLATRVLSRSPVVHTDGPRSVRAAYTLPEMRQLAQQSGMAEFSLEGQWPCRQLLKWIRPPR